MKIHFGAHRNYRATIRYLVSKGAAASTVMPLNDDGLLLAAGECGSTTNGNGNDMKG